MPKLNLNEEELTKQAVLLATDLHFWKVTAAARSMAEKPPGGIDPDKLSQTESLVQEQLNKPSAKRALCAALDATTTDIRSVAQVVVASLLPLAVSNVIALPLTPLAFAVAAVIVLNIGVAVYCADQSAGS